MNFGDQFEDLVTHMVSEKVDVVIQDHARDYVRDLVDETVNNAIEDLDVCADILQRIRATDIERLVRVEVGAITLRMLKGKLTEIIEEHVRTALASDEIRNAIISQVDAKIQESVQSPKIASVLDQLAKDAVSRTLERITAQLLRRVVNQGLASAGAVDPLADDKASSHSEPALHPAVISIPEEHITSAIPSSGLQNKQEACEAIWRNRLAYPTSHRSTYETRKLTRQRFGDGLGIDGGDFKKGTGGPSGLRRPCSSSAMWRR